MAFMNGEIHYHECDLRKKELVSSRSVGLLESAYKIMVKILSVVMGVMYNINFKVLSSSINKIFMVSFVST